MKVFVSSIIGGFEVYRAAAKSAITTLRHKPIVAEEFGAKASTPQIACLTGLRESDLVVLILGAEYGAVQRSGLSATAEEFHEARQHKPVLHLCRWALILVHNKKHSLRKSRAGAVACFAAASRTPKI
jgi:hypothetical protein